MAAVAVVLPQGFLPSPWPHHIRKITEEFTRAGGGLCLMPLPRRCVLLTLPPPFVLRSPVFKKESELFFSYCIPFTPARSSPEDPFFCGLNKGYITLFPLSKPHAGDGEQVEGMMVCIPVLYIFSSIIYIFRLFSVSQLRTKNNT